MTRKNIVLLLLTIAIVVIGFMGLNYFLSFKTAYINIKPRGVSVVVYNAKKQQVGKLSSSGKLSLRSGKYSVVPSGANAATSPISLTVTDKGAYLTVDPGYSQTYLASLLKGELPTINTVIAASYPNVLGNFTINQGSLLLYGDWYATTFAQKSPARGENGDVYKTVLHKENGSWKMLTTPAIVLTTKDYPSIPKNILDEANGQSGNAS